MSATTKSTFNKTWIDQGYLKSSFAITDEGEWEMIEDQVNLPHETHLDVRAEKLAIITHPGYGTIVTPWCYGEKKYERGNWGEDAAYNAINLDIQFEETLDCFYCGDN